MADGEDAPRASREGQEQGQGQATEQSAGERPYPPNPKDAEPKPPPGPEPVPALVHEQHNDVADKKWPQEDKRQHQTEQVENEEKEEKEQPQLVRPLRSALLTASRRRARSLPEPPFDSAEPPSSQDPGARPRVSSLVNVSMQSQSLCVAAWNPELCASRAIVCRPCGCFSGPNTEDYLSLQSGGGAS